MYLTSVTKLKLTSEQFAVVDSMAYRAKALYNSSLYEISKHFKDKGEYLDYSKTDLLMKNNPENTIYRSLPGALSQQLIKKLHKDFRSFFTLLKKKQNKDYDKKVDTPKYKPKNGRKELIFVKSSSSGTFIFKDNYIYITVSKDLHKGRLKLCKVPKYLESKDFNTEIKYMEIIPKNGYYELHIKYQTQEQEPKLNDASKWMSIDLGMNNLLTVTSNTQKAFILNGRPIKSINQKYNKRIAKAKSKLRQGKYTSKYINQQFSIRGYKLNNEIHKMTDFIVQSVLQKGIDFVVIGYNKKWKQNIRLGKKTNQNFVQIPFAKILQQLEYKLLLVGIEVHLQEESYTSKCSYFDQEEIKRHTTYKGNRNNRGLFITSRGVRINADVNSSLNICRKFLQSVKNANSVDTTNTAKEVHDVLLEPMDTGLVMNPIMINLRTSSSKEQVLILIQSL